MSCNAICSVPMFKRWPVGLILLALLAATLPSHAAWQNELPEAKLVGEGAFRWFGLRIYTAQLWSPALPFTDQQPFALQLTYDYDVTRDSFVDTSIDEIKRMRGDEVTAQLGKWREDLRRVFVDVRAGERLTGLWLPGRGARFFHGDRFVAELTDVALAKQFFAIWLSESSRDQRLRSKLLGKPS